MDERIYRCYQDFTTKGNSARFDLPQWELGRTPPAIPKMNDHNEIADI
jgi:hypothetical protein